MGEVLVSFETAKLAKEVGFNEPCYDLFVLHHINETPYTENSHYYYWQTTCTNDDIQEVIDERKILQINNPKDDYSTSEICTAPTQSLLQKWLREVHKIDIIPTFSRNSRTYGYNMYYTEENKPVYINKNSIKATTYEEALELALYKALTIVKNNENKT